MMSPEPFTDDELKEMFEDAERVLADLDVMLADEYRDLVVPTMECSVCGDPVLARRLDARTCSSRCRQAAYRARLRDAEEASEPAPGAT